MSRRERCSSDPNFRESESANRESVRGPKLDGTSFPGWGLSLRYLFLLSARESRGKLSPKEEKDPIKEAQPTHCTEHRDQFFFPSKVVPLFELGTESGSSSTSSSFSAELLMQMGSDRRRSNHGGQMSF